MKFEKYSKIENTTGTKGFIEKCNAIVPLFIKWSVTEKIHGANFSIHAERDGEEIKFARRLGFIQEGEKFYNWEAAIGPKFPMIQKLLMAMFMVEKDVKTISLFGELFGGSYPHEHVEKDCKFSLIQKGVFYIPFQDVLLFDVKFDGEYVSHSKVKTWSDLTNFKGLFVEELFSGSLEECLAHSNEFQSTIPARYGLPEIEDNACEGIVIKPIVEFKHHTGRRIIFKDKNTLFKEKSQIKHVKVRSEIPEKIRILEEEFTAYINDNRFNAVISKLPTITKKDFSLLSKSLSDDVLEDFRQDFSSDLFDLSVQEEKMLMKALGNQINMFVRPKFLNLTSDWV